ncbi:hypothetical protein GCM10027425_18370 [Alteromonas gracilis]
MFADGARAARFVALAREVFAEHGLECAYDQGQLLAEDGRRFGLSNLAQTLSTSRPQEWRALVEQHVDGVLAASAAPRVRDLELVRDRVYLRLWPTEDLSFPPQAAEWLGEDLVGLPAIDHPEHIETIAGEDDLEQLGGWAALREAALANLGRLTADEVSTLGGSGSRVHVSTGGWFNASRVCLMRRLLREDFLTECPPHGVLFVVPNRHTIGVHPLTGPGMYQAVAVLVSLAKREAEAPGSISPHVWFWHDDRVQQATRYADDGAVEMRVEGPLREAMLALGLAEES